MLQELLPEHPSVTTSRSRQVQRFPYLLAGAGDGEQYLAVKILRICLLGNFALLANEKTVNSLDMPRLQSLLAYLALHRSVPQSRSRIAFALWPDSTDAQAHTNLRNLLFKLRATLPEVETFLLVERLSICWQQETLWSLDVQDFEQAVERAAQARCLQNSLAERQALEQALHCYQGDLLPTCYEDWIAEERDRLQHLYLGVLERLMALLEEADDYAAAIRVAQRLLRLDPLQETTYRHLMRLYAARGDRAAISRTYQSCAAVLKRECAIAPASITRKTYERLMRAEE